MTYTNERSQAVLDLARELAAAGRADAAAVKQLRARAGNSRRLLRQAERASRYGGRHGEFAEDNLTNRLLVAAENGAGLIARTEPPDEVRIEAVSEFLSVPRAQRWAQLVSAVPALVDLERDVRGGRFGELLTPAQREQLASRGRRERVAGPGGEARVRVTLSSKDPPSPLDHETLKRTGDTHMRVERELEDLLGPRARTDDPLLGSRYAYEEALAHLLRGSD